MSKNNPRRVGKIVIRENREPLVDVRRFCPNVVVKLGRGRMAREKTAYLRRSVAAMLGAASKRLPKGQQFIINDAWRPAFIQCQIFFDFVKKGERRYPGLSRAARMREIKKYVAPWKGVNASGHMSGGAIDLRIVDTRGRKIPMRSRGLSYKENALSDQPKLPAVQKRNRALLSAALLAAGFSNYPLEYWHWSFGDYQWARRNGKPVAKYGAVADVNGIYEAEPCPCGSEKKFKKCHGK
jgi:D-alanyl-D-alanine dipeptidase